MLLQIPPNNNYRNFLRYLLHEVYLINDTCIFKWPLQITTNYKKKKNFIQTSLRYKSCRSIPDISILETLKTCHLSSEKTISNQ